MQIIYNQDLKEYIRKCSNQHDNILTANYCRKCGEQLLTSNSLEFDYRPGETVIKKYRIDETVYSVWFVDSNQLIYKNHNDQLIQLLFNDKAITQKIALPNLGLGYLSTTTDLKNLYYTSGCQVCRVSKQVFSDKKVAEDFRDLSDFYQSDSFTVADNSKLIGDNHNGIFIVSRNSIYDIERTSSYDTDFLADCLVTSNNYLTISQGRRIAVFSREDKTMKFSTDMADTVSKVIANAEEIVVLLDNGDVYYIDPSRKTIQTRKIDEMQFVRDIHFCDRDLICINDRLITAMDIVTLRKNNTVTGNFSRDRSWIASKYIITIEQTNSYYTINVYDYKNNLRQKVKPSIIEIDKGRITKLHYAQLFLSTLIINYEDKDGKTYLAMVQL